MENITIPLTTDKNCKALKLNWIEAGSFMMGKNEIITYDGFHHEPHGEFEVTLSRGYWLGVYPVTQCQWYSMMRTNPSDFIGYNKPVTMVSWQDAIDFCNCLNKIELPDVSEGYIFNLPTEAQWEFACKAGSQNKYQIGNTLEDLSTVAWHRNNSDSVSVQDVGQKVPNNWGIYDMLGNVMEWCFDAPKEYPDETKQTDWIGEVIGEDRNLRGGSVFTSHESDVLTCSGRMYGWGPNNFYGFRICLRPKLASKQKDE